VGLQLPEALASMRHPCEDRPRAYPHDAFVRPVAAPDGAVRMTLADVINRYCPRSGKPVEADSLVRYRGLVVGFCNPRCRDDFAAHVAQRPLDTRYFDALIQERDLATADASV
jgi:endogenous inhibitor of DNA gyrase (YacG/DUF329 family)